MKAQLIKSVISWMFTLLCLGSLLTSVVWYVADKNNVKPSNVVSPEKRAGPKASSTCKGCKDVYSKVKAAYSQTWKWQEANNKNFRSQLNSNCQGFIKAIVTQANSPVGSTFVFDGDKRRKLQVSPEIFQTFVKEHPFPNRTMDTCAVVGNGGILANSSCGNMIDSAQYVIRCNLPPLENGYMKDVGIKTNLVTANPSILMEKYGSLMGRRRPFVESLDKYGNSLLVLPAFSYAHNTAVSLRVAYSVEEFQSPARPVFFNPEYLAKLAVFWRSQGVKATRLSTGIIVASLALELCKEVHLYGFWPFSNHLEDQHVLTNHYYDDRRGRPKFHAMPTEFELLLRLHSQGVLKLHLGTCPEKK